MSPHGAGGSGNLDKDVVSNRHALHKFQVRFLSEQISVQISMVTASQSL